MTRSAPTNLPLKGETLGRRPLRPISGTARQGCHCPTWSIPFVGTDVPIGPRREQVPTYGFTGRKSLWRQPHVAACHRRGPPQARALNKGAQQIQISHTSGSGRKSNRPLDFCPRAGWKTQTSIGVHRREIFRNRRFLNGVLNQGSQQSPAPVGLLGKGGARERTQVSPLGGSGAERTLRRRAAVGKGTRRRSGEITFEASWESVFHCVRCRSLRDAHGAPDLSLRRGCRRAASLVRGRL